MRIFDFFRSRKEKEEPEEKKAVSLADLDIWAENRFSKLEREKREFNELVKSNSYKLAEELRKGIISLNNINWEKIKENNRVKQIVKENLRNYVFHLGQLASNLENLEKTNQMKDKLISMFSAFENKAGLNYHKSTFLIGKELEGINNSLLSFSKDLKKMCEEKNELLQNFDDILIVREKLKTLDQSEKIILNVRDGVLKTDSQIRKLESEIKDYEAELIEVKKSAEYLEWEERKNKLKEKNENLKREIQTLYWLVDFKVLARLWHENSKEMSVVKEYKDNFYESFLKDEREVLARLVNLLENKEALNKKIVEITDLEKEVKNTMLENSPVSEFEEKIKKTRNEVLNLYEIKDIENKKVEKLVFAKNNLLNVLNFNISAFGFRLF